MEKFLIMILSIMLTQIFSDTFASNIRSEITSKNILALSPDMLSTLKQQQNLYQEKLLQTHPVIVALFSPRGGKFILYRPGKKPVVAAAIPHAQEYVFSTVIQHTAMQAYELSVQGMQNPQKNTSWQGQMSLFEERVKLAEKDIDALNVSAEEKHLYKLILTQTSGYLQENLKQGALSSVRMDTYAKAIKPNLTQLTKIVATEQVTHWMDVTQQWKQLLGNEWRNTYGVVIYIPVHPQNNIFLDIFIHFKGKDAVGKQIFYFTSTSYSPTVAQALEELSRATPDQALANEVFGQYYLMYSGILGVTARRVIANRS